MAAWVGVEPALVGRRGWQVLSAPPDARRWQAEIANLAAPLVYLAPGDGPDDDPGVAVLATALAGVGRSARSLGQRGIEVEGPAVIGAAWDRWRPDPTKHAYVRGVANADRFCAWTAVVRQEFGASAPVTARAWTATAWSLVHGPESVSGFPLTLHVAPNPASQARGLEGLRDVVETLRGPTGCPWDREQTHASLRPYLLEEAYEAVAAIESGGADGLVDELGDVLLQVALHAEIARQAHQFGWPDVVEAIATKLVRRHPHVFGDAVAPDAAAVAHKWEQIKRAERGGALGDFDDLPLNLPALALARELAVRARRLGIDLRLPDGLVEPARRFEGDGAVPDAARLGDALVAVVAYADRAGLGLETVVRDAALRLRARLDARPRP